MYVTFDPYSFTTTQVLGMEPHGEGGRSAEQPELHHDDRYLGQRDVSLHECCEQCILLRVRLACVRSNWLWITLVLLPVAFTGPEIGWGAACKSGRGGRRWRNSSSGRQWRVTQFFHIRGKSSILTSCVTQFFISWCVFESFHNFTTHSHTHTYICIIP